VILAFGKQFANQFIFSGKEAADIIDERLGIGRQHKAADKGNMLLDTFLFNLGKWEAELFLTRRDPATGRSLKGTPFAYVGIASLGQGHDILLPDYPTFPL